jgi:hypothetical protein
MRPRWGPLFATAMRGWSFIRFCPRPTGGLARMSLSPAMKAGAEKVRPPSVLREKAIESVAVLVPSRRNSGPYCHTT